MSRPIRVAEQTVTHRRGRFAEGVFDRVKRREAQFACNSRAINPVIAEIGVLVGDGYLDRRKVPPRKFQQATFLIVFANDVKHTLRRFVGR